MAAGYDGSIRIDSRIDESGFNAGMAKISTSAKRGFSGLLTTVSGVAKGIGNVALGTFERIVQSVKRLMLGLVVALLLGAGEIMSFLRDALTAAGRTTGELGNNVRSLQAAFGGLRNALFGVFAGLLSAALPYIIIVVNWLTRMLNLLSMIIAAFRGQTTVMQYTVTTASEAAAATEKIAKNTGKAKKEAQGALAAFDQINVLQKKTAAETAAPATPATGAGGVAVTEQAVPIEPKVLETVNNIKKWFAEAWKWISDKATAAWNWIKQAWADAGTFFQNLWAGVSTWAVNTWESIKTTWGKVVTWFKTNIIDPLIAFWAPVWEFVKILANDAWVTLVFLWGKAAEWFKANVTDRLSTLFTVAWSLVQMAIAAAWGKLVTLWAPFGAWLSTNVTEPFKSKFGTALDWVRTKWETMFTGLKSFVRGVFNGVLEVINGLLRRITSGVNGIIGSLNTFGSAVPGWIRIPNVSAPQIPYLATGAVIPPNAKFAAILGDQRNGKNLEAPEGLIRQIIREELGSASNDMTANITLQLDGETIYRNQQRVSRRRGTSLITGEAG